MFTDSLHHMSVPGLVAGQKITKFEEGGWVGGDRKCPTQVGSKIRARECRVIFRTRQALYD